MKVRSSVKPICPKCKVVKRNGKVSGLVQLWRHICPAGAGLLDLVVLGQLFQHSRVQ